MGYVKVYTQDEMERVLGDAVHTPELMGDAEYVVTDSATVRAWDNATVRAWDSATVRAWGSATVHAGDSATVHAGDSATVRAWGSATVRAWGSATVHAGGSATVHAGDSATVRAGKFVAVQKYSPFVSTDGGHVIEIMPAQSPEDWAAIYLAEVREEGAALVLYKAVDDAYRSAHGFEYRPGSVPVADDWDGGEEECGGGLHFCSSPAEALTYQLGATRFMACPVALVDLAVVPNPEYPNKIKARRCCAPIWEVDINGNRVEP